MDKQDEVRASFPGDALRAAVPAPHEAHQSIDGLEAELQQPNPQRASIEQHVDALRSVHELEAIIANWWDSPSTQEFISDLTRIGL
jgi:hypothetical protein